ncbi:hypothetical protein PGTUg99_017298 [Puccinia graminis f. sp. tritici]|uniref:Uncharacterized protein n=1 Tax=Puccinia graminis f. sp. tritici TaxID=56615 RepID=A0A5B0S6P9_PUCGR|nr:hypothetical protein PGTUg99_017298 [Puccinia graminis f. sp. tritici]
MTSQALTSRISLGGPSRKVYAALSGADCTVLVPRRSAMLGQLVRLCHLDSRRKSNVAFGGLSSTRTVGMRRPPDEWVLPFAVWAGESVGRVRMRAPSPPTTAPVAAAALT